MDLIDIARYFFALVLVLALLGFAALAARRYGVPGVAQGTRKRRLGVVETLMIGPRHKLLLLRRDDSEHLVLVGPHGASVIANAVATVPVAAAETVT